MFSRFFEEKKASNDNKIENKILGDGAYGCVITPPITKDILKEYIEYKNPEPTDVGKLFKPSSHSRNYFDLELKIAKGVNDIDRDGTFSINLKGANMINAKSIKYNNIKNCIYNNRGDDSFTDFDLMDKPTDVYQIIYENGGLDLNELKSVEFLKFIKMFVNFLGGIKKIHANGLIHYDIKADNILINDKKISLIDFGVSELASKVYNNYDELANINRQIIKHYPIEIYIAYVLYPYKDDAVEYRERLAKIPEIMNNYYIGALRLNKPQKAYTEVVEFVEEIKYKSYEEVFNKNLAYKIDIYGLHFIFKKLSHKIIYNNEDERKLIYELYNMTSSSNPLKRASIDDLLKMIEFPDFYIMKGGKIPKK